MPSLLRSAATSCSIMAAGDVLCQALCSRGSAAAADPPPPLRQHIDWRQTARFAAVGAMVHGPFFHAGFRWLDRLGVAHPAFAGKGPLGSAVLKTAIGQVTLFPIYTAGERRCCLCCAPEVGGAAGRAVLNTGAAIFPTCTAGEQRSAALPALLCSLLPAVTMLVLLLRWLCPLPFVQQPEGLLACPPNTLCTQLHSRRWG